MVGGLLRDGMLGRQTASSLREVLSPKLAGTLALAAATYGAPLAAMTLFSSIAALLGNPGQANYAAANGVLDAFAGIQHAQARCRYVALSFTAPPVATSTFRRALFAPKSSPLLTLLSPRAFN